ncbi:MAG TPA: protein kinase, partial [Polyangiaceae bacterium]
PYMVSERVAWPALSEQLKNHGPLTTEQLAAGLQQLARALEVAHRAGLVHRGIKPQNVFISVENPGQVRITDFGISVLRIAAPPPPGWGATPGWHGPDAAEPSSKSTSAMDVYAVGLICFFALTGRSPFAALREGELDLQKLWMEMVQPIGSAAARARESGVELNPVLDGWFAKALAPHPKARFASVAELASAFEPVARSASLSTSASREVARSAETPAEVGKEARSQPSHPVAESVVDAASSPSRSSSGIAVASVQPLAFMPSLPPPPGVRLERDDKETKGSPGERVRSSLTLVVLVVASLVCLAGIALVATLLYAPPVPQSRLQPRESAEPESAMLPPASSPIPVETTAVAAASGSTPPAAADAGRRIIVDPNLAVVTFKCQPGECDSVYCDGKEIPDFRGPVALPLGNHTCKALKTGYKTRSQTFRLISQDNVTRTFVQTKQAAGTMGGGIVRTLE